MRFLIAALIAGVLGTVPVLAAEGDVSLAGQVILRIRFPAAGYTVAQRADAVQSRINTVLSTAGTNAQDVVVKKVNKEVAVCVKNQLIITADWTTARYNKTTPDKLAATWADNLRKTLPAAMPRGYLR